MTRETDRQAGSSMNLTKAVLIGRLHEEVGLNKREAKEFVEAFFELQCEALEGGEHVKLSGFGNFALRRKGARPGRNPKTGDQIPIAPRTVVTFHPGQKLKDRIALQSGVDGASDEEE
jgi:integration host factor subunit alpha